MPENFSNSSINRKLSSLKNQIYDAVEDRELVDSILNSHPRPFPTTFPMDKGSRQDHARLGRLFEIELLCIRVYACACCGRTKPYADGPNSKSRVTTNFHRQNLADKYYPAFFCGCDICKGQFFCIDRSKHMKAYKEKHKMKTKPPDCMLCAHCYSEFASDGTTIFCVGRQFSARNGFGPFPVLPKMCPSDFDITLKPLPLTLLPSHI